MEKQLPYSVTIQLTPPTPADTQYVTIIGKALAVDKQIDEKNVQKVITVTQQGVTVKVSANELKLLRACVTGLCRHMRLVSETIAEFKDIQ